MHIVCPVAPWYFPDGHAVHAVLPVVFLYVPAPHDVQGPPSLPVFPTEQMHAVTATLPVTDTLEPDGHAEQSAVPAVAAYVPTGHREQDAESMPLVYVPASQAVQLPPPAASSVNPAGHPQLMLPSADAALIGQVVHTADPMPPLYVPAVHAAQLPPLAAASPVKPAAHAQLLIDVFPSADTTLMGTPTEQPQNTTAGRWSPISARQARGLEKSEGREGLPSQPPSRHPGVVHPPSLHAENRSKNEVMSGRKG